MLSFSFLAFAAASFIAGIVNTLAGGGSFLTFPALLLTGLDARAANMTSTIALFPMQVTSGYSGRKMAGGTQTLSLKTLFIISVIGGFVGAGLLLLTPSTFFARLVPWLILFATCSFAYGSFRKKKVENGTGKHIDKNLSIFIQFCISVYGGYFGGGIGFLMLAALTLAGMPIRQAGATKNILAGVMNASAVLIFLFSKDIGWMQVLVGIGASIIGGQIGVRLLHKVNEKILRAGIVFIGLALTVAMFYQSPQ